MIPAPNVFDGYISFYIWNQYLTDNIMYPLELSVAIVLGCLAPRVWHISTCLARIYTQVNGRIYSTLSWWTRPCLRNQSMFVTRDAIRRRDITHYDVLNPERNNSLFDIKEWMTAQLPLWLLSAFLQPLNPPYLWNIRALHCQMLPLYSVILGERMF